MMKADLDSETGILTFNHVGGVMAFDVKGVPAGASSFSFKTSKKISGLFQVKDDKISVGSYVNAAAKELGGSIKVTGYVRYDKGKGRRKEVGLISLTVINFRAFRRSKSCKVLLYCDS